MTSRPDSFEDHLGTLHVVGEFLLRAVAGLCDQEGIQFYLNGGSLLGAVRHGGWIPWDDDVDIMMKRGEYLRFLAVADRLPDGVHVSDPALTRGHTSAVPRVIYSGARIRCVDRFGISARERQFVSLDIFLLDDGPPRHWMYEPWRLCTQGVRAVMAARGATLAGIWKSSGERLSIRLAVSGARVVGLLVPGRAIARFYARLCSVFNGRGGDFYVSLNSAGRHARIRFPRSVFDQNSTQVEFCGISYPAPDPSPFLGELYGHDFMKPPPESERRPHPATDLQFTAHSPIDARVEMAKAPGGVLRSLDDLKAGRFRRGKAWS